ncbi:MAG: DUF72 domain-containing protein [Candidatus Eremiobacteraeota bacterium]|nr:DUF72 domain-containing protein [Candidatus Eremiobacteraeota bacterium]
MSQLDLFGGHEADRVEVSPDSPLSRTEVAAGLKTLPGLYLGTSSWSFPGWRGLVYKDDHTPAQLAATGLRAYAEVPLFRTVSLDRTYYKPMSYQQFRELSEQVPSEFRFVVKAPRELLKPTASGIDLSLFSREFLTPVARGLGENLGVVLLQFPPGTNADHGGRFLSRLGPFLRGLPRGLHFSLEIRDQDLLGPELTECLKGTGVSICASIHSTLPNPDQQLLKVPPLPETPLVFRWNIRPSLDYEQARNRYQPFNRLQSEDTGRRTLLVKLVERALKAGRMVYLTANNKAEGCAPLTLLRFLEELSSYKA